MVVPAVVVALPVQTGVIEIGVLHSTLHRIGYDGLITPEPYYAELKELPPDDTRLDVVALAMQAMFRTVGLPGA